MNSALLFLAMASLLGSPSLAFLRHGIPNAAAFVRTKSLGSVDPSFANDGNDTIVTREMFMRDLLEDPKVRRKTKGSGYKVLDNRDSLPYQVQLSTPDPYTHPDVKRKNVKKLRKRLDSVEERIASSLFTSNNDESNTDMTLLGEFSLDKHTTTGDLIAIGDTEYRVVKHRCQYKYAGGKRFVMVRKILQVTEVGRLQAEEYIKRQFKQSSENDSMPSLD